jgi:hypothetical protein
VANSAGEVAADVAKFLASDLLIYRAEGPEGLVERQAASWDPVIAWARDVLGARFVLAAGMIYVTQSEEALAAARAAIPHDIWRLGAGGDQPRGFLEKLQAGVLARPVAAIAVVLVAVAAVFSFLLFMGPPDTWFA